MSHLAEAAADYLRGGHRLLLLSGKRPNTKYHREWSWENSIHGDPDKAGQSLWDALEDPSVTGLAILIPPHQLVADIDTEEAARLFHDLAGNPSGTAIGRTVNGLHVWYLAPGEAASRWLGGRTLLFKGHGGYVAVEPSRHFAPDGTEDGQYRWVTDISEGIDWLPDGIATMMKADALREAMKPESDPDMVGWELQFAEEGRDWQSAYPVWQMDGLVRVIRDAAEGNQNNVIHWAACVARDGGVPLPVSMHVLLDAALAGNHPRSRAVSTIRGAYKARRG